MTHGDDVTDGSSAHAVRHSSGVGVHSGGCLTAAATRTRTVFLLRSGSAGERVIAARRCCAGMQQRRGEEEEDAVRYRDYPNKVAERGAAT